MSAAERQAKHRTKQSRREAEMQILIAALFRLVPEADRRRIEQIPRFARLLRDANLLASYMEQKK